MSELQLRERASRNPKGIVYPEVLDTRILRAALPPSPDRCAVDGTEAVLVDADAESGEKRD